MAKTTRRKAPAIERLMAHIVETPGPLITPCWICTYAPGTGGYAHIKIARVRVSAHRFSYEHYIGPVPAGLQLDHLCRIRICCNPVHLEPVTALENLMRSDHRSAIAHRTNICIRGHSLDDAHVRSDGTRTCRLCALARQQGRRNRRRLMGLPRD